MERDPLANQSKAATLEKHYKKMKAAGGVATPVTGTPTPGANGTDAEMEG